MKFSKMLRLASQPLELYNEIFGFLVRINWRHCRARAKLFSISDFSYWVALNAAHK
jgi:hypothetical protein